MAQADRLTPANFESNDYYHLPATPKQVDYARRIARQASLPLPEDVLGDRRALSDWIDRHKPRQRDYDAYLDRLPSSKQVAFAERIARIRRRHIPRECFKDRTTMSRWIDSNR